MSAVRRCTWPIVAPWAIGRSARAIGSMPSLMVPRMPARADIACAKSAQEAGHAPPAEPGGPQREQPGGDGREDHARGRGQRQAETWLTRDERACDEHREQPRDDERGRREHRARDLV